MGIVAVGSFTLVDVNDGLNGRLSLNSIVVPTASDGTGGDFSKATTTMSIMLGNQDDTTNWTFSAVSSDGVSGTLIGSTYLVTNLTRDSGIVDLTAKRIGFPDITNRFTISKAKRGEAGPSVTVTASAAGFVFTDDQPTPAKQTISLQVQRHGNITAPALFFASNGAQLDHESGLNTGSYLLNVLNHGDGDLVWIDLEDLGSDQQMYVTTVVGDITHVTHIPRLNFYTAEAGATRNVFRGAWAKPVAYSKGDQVTSGGQGWAAKVAHLSSDANQPPEYPATENATWAVAAVKGDRGTVTTSAAIAGSAWTDAAANQAISIQTKGLSPMAGDVVTLYNSALSFSQTRVFLTNGTWSPLAAFFGGDVLVDGTLVGAKLAAQTITGANIAGTTITGQNMVAGTITGIQIAAKAIGVEKLVVTGAGNAINSDPLFEDASLWTFTGVSIVPVTEGVGPRALSASTSVQASWANTRYPIDPSKTYLFETTLRNIASVGGRTFASIRFYNAAGALISAGHSGWTQANGLGQSGSNFYLPRDNTVTPNAWTRYTATIGPNGVAQFPTGAVSFSLGFYIGYGSSTSGEQQVNSFRVTEMARGELIVDGSITASKVTTGELITLSAQIKDAIISSAKIIDLDAAQVRAGTAIAGTITVNGSQLGVVKNNAELGAQDPGTRINSGTTQIDPGKIRISGATTLSSWIKGGDETRIDGGAISANTITANKLEIGSRNITLEGITFEHNSPAANRASWTAGKISYVNDLGATVTKDIAAGSTGVLGTLPIFYIHWVKDATAFTVSTNLATAFDVNSVVIATYKGGIDLDADYGRTIIDGSALKTGTVDALQIKANAIRSNHIESDSIQSRHVLAGQITASKVLVSDTSNMVPDSSYGDTAAWTFSSTALTEVTFVENPIAGVAGRAVQFNIATTGAVATAREDIMTDYIPVEGGRAYFGSYARMTQAGVTGDTDVRVIEYDALRNALATTIIGPTPGTPTTTALISEGIITLNPLTVYVRLQYRRTHSAAIGKAWLWNVQFRRAASAELIVDGTITGVKIKANEIDGTHIKAGSINTEHLTVGGSGNILLNSTFENSTFDFWALYNPSGGTLSVVYDNWSPSIATVQMRGNGYMQSYTNQVTIVPGQRYQASAYVNCHRCAVNVFLRFFDASNTPIGDFIASTPSMMGDPQGHNLGAFNRLNVFAVAPANARTAHVLIQKSENDPGQGESYGWFLRPFLGEALPNQTVPSPWSPAGVTQISGGMIMTDALLARHITARQINADKIVLNGIDVSVMGYGAHTTVVSTGVDHTWSWNGASNFLQSRTWISLNTPGKITAFFVGYNNARAQSSGSNGDINSAKGGSRIAIDGNWTAALDVGAGDHYIDHYMAVSGVGSGQWVGTVIGIGSKKS